MRHAALAGRAAVIISSLMLASPIAGITSCDGRKHFTRSVPLIPRHWHLPLSLRGGSMTNSEIKDSLAEIDRTMDRSDQELRKVNSTAADRIAELQRKFAERAEAMAVHGREDTGENDPDFDPDFPAEVREAYMEDGVFSVSRREYTEDDPFENPNPQVRAFIDGLLNRTAEDINQLSDESSEPPVHLAFIPAASHLLFSSATSRPRTLTCPQRVHRPHVSAYRLTTSPARALTRPCGGLALKGRRSLHSSLIRASSGRPGDEKDKDAQGLKGVRQRWQRLMLDVDPRLLVLDVLVVLSLFFAQAAVHEAALEGPQNLWGLAKPITGVDGVQLAQYVDRAACVSIAWIISCIINENAGKESVINGRKVAVTRTLRSAVWASPAAALMTMVTQAGGLPSDELIGVLVGPVVCLALWRSFYAEG